MTSKVTTNRKALDRLAAGIGDVAKQVQQETLEETAELAKRRVHVITGQTLGSIRVEGDTVAADYGAFWEEQRGGAHAFLSSAFRDALAHGGERLAEKLRNLASG